LQKATQRQRVVQAISEQRWQQYLEALRDRAEVVDVRNEVLNQPVPANAGF
jgi:hypothetical protein